MESKKQIWQSLKFYLLTKLYKIDVSFKKAGRFIDLETFIRDENDEAFIKMTVKPRLPFLKVGEKIKTYAIALYIIETDELKQSYPWIYNPPQFISEGEITQGSIERENFAKDYGAYMEMVYLCSGMNPINWETVFDWETTKFLFLAEYLVRKRTVENLK